MGIGPGWAPAKTAEKRNDLPGSCSAILCSSIRYSGVWASSLSETVKLSPDCTVIAQAVLYNVDTLYATDIRNPLGLGYSHKTSWLITTVWQLSESLREMPSYQSVPHSLFPLLKWDICSSILLKI